MRSFAVGGLRVHVFGGWGEIGGNQLLLEAGGEAILLDFGRPFGRWNQCFTEFLAPRSALGLRDLLALGLLPRLRGLYRDGPDDTLFPTALERRLLQNAVGLVKGHRLRPRNLDVVLRLPEGHRTGFHAFHREVEVHGRSLQEDVEADEDHQYPSWHLTAYVRLRESRESQLAGLVRIDLLRPDPDRESELLSSEEEQALDLWAASVYRERRPYLPGGREQPFPISLLERSLHARMPPPMALAGSLRLEGGG